MAIIIYPPTLDWSWMTQRPQQLMAQFALDGHEVYFCNKTQRTHKLFTKLTPNLNVVHNNKLFIRKRIPAFKKSGKRIIVWATCAKHYLFIRQYFPDLIVFDYVDDFQSWDPYVTPMVKQADSIFVTAERLKEKLFHSFPEKETHLVPNACHLEHFSQYDAGPPPPRPLDLPKRPGPIIGYVGAWAKWVDQELVRHVARKLPQATICIIGPEFGAKVDDSIPNIKFLGLKRHRDLPQYMYYFDACIIPFKINRVTLSTNPIKMYEYLAAGKPVISTAIPEVQHIPGVFPANDHDEFVTRLQEVLSADFQLDKQHIRHWLQDHTWKERYESIKKVIIEQGMGVV